MFILTSLPLTMVKSLFCYEWKLNWFHVTKKKKKRQDNSILWANIPSVLSLQTYIWDQMCASSCTDGFEKFPFPLQNEGFCFSSFTVYFWSFHNGMRGRWCQKATDSVYRSQVDNNTNEIRILAKGTLNIGTKNDRLID